MKVLEKLWRCLGTRFDYERALGMISNELLGKLRERAALWRSGVMPDSMYEAFVLEALSEVDADEYEIEDVLGPDAFTLLIEHGAQQLKRKGAGGMRMIASGREVDISHLADKYEELFSQWTRRGWLKSFDDGVIRGA